MDTQGLYITTIAANPVTTFVDYMYFAQCFVIVSFGLLLLACAFWVVRDGI